MKFLKGSLKSLALHIMCLGLCVCLLNASVFSGVATAADYSLYDAINLTPAVGEQVPSNYDLTGNVTLHIGDPQNAGTLPIGVTSLGTLKRKASASRSLTINGGGYSLNGAGMGGVTVNAGDTLTISSLTATGFKRAFAANSGTVVLSGTVKLDNSITGAGETKVDGAVTANAKIANKITIDDNASLTISADNVGGSVTNKESNGKLVLTGDSVLKQEIIGAVVQDGGAVKVIGTTEIAGNVTSDAKIANTIIIDEGKSLTISAENLAGNVTNEGSTLTFKSGDAVINYDIDASADKRGTLKFGSGVKSLGLTTKVSPFVTPQYEDIVIGGTLKTGNAHLDETDDITLVGLAGAKLDITTDTEEKYNDTNIRNFTAKDGTNKIAFDMAIQTTEEETKPIWVRDLDRVYINGSASGTVGLALSVANISEEPGKFEILEGDTTTTSLFSTDTTGVLDKNFRIIGQTVSSLNRSYVIEPTTTLGEIRVTIAEGTTLYNAINGTIRVIEQGTSKDKDPKVIKNVAVNSYDLQADTEIGGSGAGALPSGVTSLGTLTHYVTQARDFTIIGNNHTLNAGANIGGVVVAQGNTLTLSNITVSGFKDDSFVTNSGTVEFADTVNMKSSVANNGTMKVTGTTIFAPNFGVSGNGEITNVGSLTIEADRLGNNIVNEKKNDYGLILQGTVYLGKGTLREKITGGAIVTVGNVTSDPDNLASTAGITNSGYTLDLIDGGSIQDSINGTGTLKISSMVGNNKDKLIVQDNLTVINVGNLTSEVNKLIISKGIANDGVLNLTSNKEDVNELEEGITGTGKTYFNGTYEVIANGAISQKSVDVGADLVMNNVLATTDGTTVNSDKTLTIGASNLQSVTLNNGTIQLKAGTLGKDYAMAALPNKGTLKILENVLNETSIAQGNLIIEETGALTSEVDNLAIGAGVITNDGTLTLRSDAEGVNTLEEGVTSSQSGESKGVLNFEGKEPITAEGAISQQKVNVATDLVMNNTLAATGTKTEAGVTEAGVTVNGNKTLTIGASNLKSNVANNGTVQLGTGTLADTFTINGGAIRTSGNVTANANSLASTAGITNAQSDDVANVLTLNGGTILDNIKGISKEGVKELGTLVIAGTVDNNKKKSIEQGNLIIEEKGKFSSEVDGLVIQDAFGNPATITNDGVLTLSSSDSTTAENLLAEKILNSQSDGSKGTLNFEGNETITAQDPIAQKEVNVKTDLIMKDKLTAKDSLTVAKGKKLAIFADDLLSDVTDNKGTVQIGAGTLQHKIKGIDGNSGAIETAGYVTTNADNLVSVEGITNNYTLALNGGTILDNIKYSKDDHQDALLNITGEVLNGNDKKVSQANLLISEGGRLTSGIDKLDIDVDFTNKGVLELTAGNIQRHIDNTGTVILNGANFGEPLFGGKYPYIDNGTLEFAKDLTTSANNVAAEINTVDNDVIVTLNKGILSRSVVGDEGKVKFTGGELTVKGATVKTKELEFDAGSSTVKANANNIQAGTNKVTSGTLELVAEKEEDGKENSTSLTKDLANSGSVVADSNVVIDAKIANEAGKGKVELKEGSSFGTNGMVANGDLTLNKDVQFSVANLGAEGPEGKDERIANFDSKEAVYNFNATIKKSEDPTVSQINVTGDVTGNLKLGVVDLTGVDADTDFWEVYGYKNVQYAFTQPGSNVSMLIDNEITAMLDGASYTFAQAKNDDESDNLPGWMKITRGNYYTLAQVVQNYHDETTIEKLGYAYQAGNVDIYTLKDTEGSGIYVEKEDLKTLTRLDKKEGQTEQEPRSLTIRGKGLKFIGTDNKGNVHDGITINAGDTLNVRDVSDIAGWKLVTKRDDATGEPVDEVADTAFKNSGVLNFVSEEVPTTLNLRNGIINEETEIEKDGVKVVVKGVVSFNQDTILSGTLSGKGTYVNTGTMTAENGENFAMDNGLENSGIVYLGKKTDDTYTTLGAKIAGGVLNIVGNVEAVADRIAGDSNVITGSKTLKLTKGNLTEKVSGEGTLEISEDVSSDAGFIAADVNTVDTDATLTLNKGKLEVAVGGNGTVKFTAGELAADVTTSVLNFDAGQDGTVIANASNVQGTATNTVTSGALVLNTGTLNNENGLVNSSTVTVKENTVIDSKITNVGEGKVTFEEGSSFGTSKDETGKSKAKVIGGALELGKDVQFKAANLENISTLTSNSTLEEDKAAIYNVNADVTEGEVTIDKIDLAETGVAIGQLRLGSIDLTGADDDIWKIYTSKEAQYLNHINDGSNMVLLGNVTAMLDGASYTFEQALGDDGVAKVGWMKITRGNFYTLAQVVQNYHDTEGGRDYYAGNINVYTLMADADNPEAYIEKNDLNELTRVDPEKSRSLTIRGKGLKFIGTDNNNVAHEGITVANADDELNLVDISEISDWENKTAFINAGKLNFSSDDGIKLNLKDGINNRGGVVTFAQDTILTGELTGAGIYKNTATMSIADAELLTMGNGLDNSGTVNLGGDKDTKLSVKIAGGVLNIIGNVEAQANYIAGDTNVIAENKTLKLFTEGESVEPAELAGVVSGAGALEIASDVSSKADYIGAGTNTVDSGATLTLHEGKLAKAVNGDGAVKFTAGELAADVTTSALEFDAGQDGTVVANASNIQGGTNTVSSGTLELNGGILDNKNGLINKSVVTVKEGATVNSTVTNTDASMTFERGSSFGDNGKVVDGTITIGEDVAFKSAFESASKSSSLENIAKLDSNWAVYDFDAHIVKGADPVDPKTGSTVSQIDLVTDTDPTKAGIATGMLKLGSVDLTGPGSDESWWTMDDHVDVQYLSQISDKTNMLLSGSVTAILTDGNSYTFSQAIDDKTKANIIGFMRITKGRGYTLAQVVQNYEDKSKTPSYFAGNIDIYTLKGDDDNPAIYTEKNDLKTLTRVNSAVARTLEIRARGLEFIGTSLNEEGKWVAHDGITVNAGDTLKMVDVSRIAGWQITDSVDTAFKNSGTLNFTSDKSIKLKLENGIINEAGGVVTFAQDTILSGKLTGAGSYENKAIMTVANAANLAMTGADGLTNTNGTVYLGNDTESTLGAKITGGALNIVGNVVAQANYIAGSTNEIAENKTLQLTKGELGGQLSGAGTLKVAEDVSSKADFIGAGTNTVDTGATLTLHEGKLVEAVNGDGAVKFTAGELAADVTTNALDFAGAVTANADYIQATKNTVSSGALELNGGTLSKELSNSGMLTAKAKTVVNSTVTNTDTGSVTLETDSSFGDSGKITNGALNLGESVAFKATNLEGITTLNSDKAVYNFDAEITEGKQTVSQINLAKTGIATGKLMLGSVVLTGIGDATWAVTDSRDVPYLNNINTGSNMVIANSITAMLSDGFSYTFTQAKDAETGKTDRIGWMKITKGNSYKLWQVVQNYHDTEHDYYAGNITVYTLKADADNPARYTETENLKTLTRVKPAVARTLTIRSDRIDDGLQFVGNGHEGVTINAEDVLNIVNINEISGWKIGNNTNTAFANSGKLNFTSEKGSIALNLKDGINNEAGGVVTFAQDTILSGKLTGEGSYVNTKIMTVADAANLAMTGTNGLENSGTVNLGNDTESILGAKIADGVLNVAGNVIAKADYIAGGTNEIAENKTLKLTKGELGGQVSGAGTLKVAEDVSSIADFIGAATNTVDDKATLTLHDGELAKAVEGLGTVKFTSGKLAADVTTKVLDFDAGNGTVIANASNIQGGANTVTSGALELNGGTLSKGLSNKGTVTAKAGTVVDNTVTNTGKVTLGTGSSFGNAGKIAGGALELDEKVAFGKANIDATEGVSSLTSNRAVYNFAASIIDTDAKKETKVDQINVTGPATGDLVLGDIDLTVDDGKWEETSGIIKTAQYLTNIDIKDNIKIFGDTTVAVGSSTYTFAQALDDTTKEDKIGYMSITKAKGYDLYQVVQNYEDKTKKPHYFAGNIKVYILEGENVGKDVIYTEQNDLGSLTRVNPAVARELTIRGNSEGNMQFIGGDHEGITVNAGDTLNMVNISKISGWKIGNNTNTAFANSGNLNFKVNGVSNALDLNDGIINNKGGVVTFLQDTNLLGKLSGEGRYVNQGTMTVADAAQLDYDVENGGVFENSGTVNLNAGTLAKAIANSGTVKLAGSSLGGAYVTSGTLEFASNLETNASYVAADINKVDKDVALTLNTGELNNTISGDGTTAFNKEASFGTSGKIDGGTAILNEGVNFSAANLTNKTTLSANNAVYNFGVTFGTGSASDPFIKATTLLNVNKATGTIGLGSVALAGLVSKDWEVGKAQQMQYLGTDAIEKSDLTITSATFVTSDAYRYTFDQATETVEGVTKDKIGYMNVTKTPGYTLKQIVNATPSDAADVNPYQLVFDYTEKEDLGVLRRVQDTPRTFTILGQGHKFAGNNHEGITINEGDTLNVLNVAEISGWKDSAKKKNVVFTNSGNLNFSGSNEKAPLALNDGIVNNEKGTVTFADWTALSGKLEGAGSYVNQGTMSVADAANLAMTGANGFENNGTLKIGDGGDAELNAKITGTGGILDFNGSKKITAKGEISQDKVNVNTNLDLQANLTAAAVKAAPDVIMDGLGVGVLSTGTLNADGNLTIKNLNVKVEKYGEIGDDNTGNLTLSNVVFEGVQKETKETPSQEVENLIIPEGTTTTLKNVTIYVDNDINPENPKNTSNSIENNRGELRLENVNIEDSDPLTTPVLRINCDLTIVSESHIKASYVPKNLNFDLDGKEKGNRYTFIRVREGESIELAPTTTVGLYQADTYYKLAKGGTMTLIDKVTGKYVGAPVIKTTKGIRSYLYSVYTAPGEYAGFDALMLGYMDQGPSEFTKSFTQAHLAMAAAINSAGDLVASSVIENAKADGKNWEAFASLGGVRNRYDEIGSEMNLSMFNVAAGLSKMVIDNLTLGIFAEGGNGHYDTDNRFPDGSVAAKGDINYFGGGLFVKAEGKMTDLGQLHGEASFRVGHINGKYNSSTFNPESFTSFDMGSAYMGAHAGFGYRWNVTKEGNNEGNIDSYVKYLWSKKDGVSPVVDGEQFDLDAINSHRIRVGLRYSSKKNRVGFNYFGGLAYEHEFAGKSTGHMGEYVLPESNFTGESGMVELGLKFQREKCPWRGEFAVQGYIGERDSIGVNLSVWYMFGR